MHKFWYKVGRGAPLQVRFFRTEDGNEPVRRWLKQELSKEDRARIGEDIKLVQLGWPVGMPTCCPLGKGLHEVRTTLHTRIARVIFCFYEGDILLLHGFIKKSQQTSMADLDLVRQRYARTRGKR